MRKQDLLGRGRTAAVVAARIGASGLSEPGRVETRRKPTVTGVCAPCSCGHTAAELTLAVHGLLLSIGNGDVCEYL